MSDSMSQHCPNCEAQAAEIEKFSGIAKLAILKAYDTDKFSTARIDAQAAEIERLRDVLKRIAGGWPKPMQLAREALEQKK